MYTLFIVDELKSTLSETWENLKAFIRGLVILFDSVSFSVLEKAYDLFAGLANETLISPEIVSQIRSNMYVIVGIFAFFRIAVLLINAMVSPDSLIKQGAGLSKVAANVVLMIVLLVVTPVLFGMSRELSKTIVDGAYIQKLFTGASGDEDDNPGATMERVAVSGIILPYDQFVVDLNSLEPSDSCDNDECKNAISCLQEIKSGESSGVGCVNDNGNVNWDELAKQNKAKSSDGKSYIYNYRGFILTLVGWFMAYVLLSFSFDVAKRMVELAVLEITAPLFIATIVDPKSMSGGTFSKWLKAVGTSYVGLFIRQAGVAIIILFAQLLTRWQPASDGVGTFGKVIVLLGILIFAKGAPQWLGNLIGIDSSGLGGLGIGKKVAGAALVGGALTKAAHTAAGAASGAAGMLAQNARTRRQQRKQVRKEEGLTHGKKGREKRQALSKENGGYFAGRKALHQARKKAYEEAGVNLTGADINNKDKKGNPKSAIGRNLGQIGASLLIGGISGGKAGMGADNLKGALKNSKDAIRGKSQEIGLNGRTVSERATTGVDNIVKAAQNAWGNAADRFEQKEEWEKRKIADRCRAAGTDYEHGSGENKIAVGAKEVKAVLNGQLKGGAGFEIKSDADKLAKQFAVTNGVTNIEKTADGYTFTTEDGKTIKKTTEEIKNNCGGVLSPEGVATFLKSSYNIQQDAVSAYSDNVQAQANAVSSYNNAASSYNNVVNARSDNQKAVEKEYEDFYSKAGESFGKLGDIVKNALTSAGIAGGLNGLIEGNFSDIGSKISKTIDELNKNLNSKSEEERGSIKEQITILESLKENTEVGANKEAQGKILEKQADTFKATMESSRAQLEIINNTLGELRPIVNSVAGNTESEKMQTISREISSLDKKLEAFKDDKK